MESRVDFICADSPIDSQTVLQLKVVIAEDDLKLSIQ
jgi:hypothetical protein